MRDYYCPDMENCEGRRRGACVGCHMLRTRVQKTKGTVQEKHEQQSIENTKSVLPESSINHYMSRFMNGQ